MTCKADQYLAYGYKFEGSDSTDIIFFIHGEISSLVVRLLRLPLYQAKTWWQVWQDSLLCYVYFKKRHPYRTLVLVHLASQFA